MFGFNLRGVLLPLIFFITLQINAQAKISSLYDVFYQDLKSYSRWVKSERDNTFKDIFVQLYNLPSKRQRKYSQKVDLKVMESFSDSKANTAYTYLEFKSRTSVNFVIWGVKKGSVKINGSKKGDIKINNDTGFALLKGTFEKGVYFISFKIKERFKGVPVVVLSDKKVKEAKRGFNRNASSSAKIYNIKARYPEVRVSQLYRGFCFPFEQKEHRDLFYSLSMKKELSEQQKRALIFKLFQLTVNEKADKLKKAGFSKNQLNWWKGKMFKNEVCSYER